jgi:hypothetical protein
MHTRTAYRYTYKIQSNRMSDPDQERENAVRQYRAQFLAHKEMETRVKNRMFVYVWVLSCM